MPILSDARSIRSQEALRQALLDVMTQMPFDQISLRDIASRAGVSYPTFYRHYSAKEDLLAHIARQESLNFMSQPPNEGGPSNAGEQICEFIAGRRQIWRILLSPGAIAVTREEFIRQGQDMAARGHRLNSRFPAEITSRVFASGLFEIIVWWFQQPDDFPQSEIAEMLSALVLDPVIRRRGD